MKKIMFSERFGLEQAVLAGTKTMTRRIIPDIEIDWNRRGRVTLPISGFKHGVLFMDVRSILHDDDICDYFAPAKYQPKYEVGEEVAIAQAYQALRWPALPGIDWGAITDEVIHSKGWKNKMFVKAEYMPHRIRITGIKVERLQGISDEDAMREGIRQSVIEYGDKKIVQWTYLGEKITTWYNSPREAFAALIDRISGRGTWQSNPWVYAYTFELKK